MTSRTYSQSGFLASARRLLSTIDTGLSRLNQMQFAAPWRPERTRDC